MSRLIDADELYNGSMKHEYFDFVEHDNHGRESYAYSCAMQRVAEAPTVEAIPVKWLQCRRDIYMKAYHAGHESEIHTAAILNDTLRAWQKEQEAANATDKP